VSQSTIALAYHSVVSRGLRQKQTGRRKSKKEKKGLFDCCLTTTAHNPVVRRFYFTLF
jgi:hypothetical protein